MCGTHRRPALPAYSDAAAALTNGGEPFGAVENAIDARAHLAAFR